MEQIKASFPGLVRTLEQKYHVDEIYDAVFVRPLHLLGDLLYVFDRLIIDGLVAVVGFIPRLTGLTVQPAQRGRLQGYGLGMAAGVAVAVVTVIVVSY